MSKQAGKASSAEVVTNGVGAQKLCFEVPIYRCNEDKYDDDMEKEEARCLRPLTRFREKAPQSYAAAERVFVEKECHPWPYNEVIGWIQISVRGSEIKGDLYFVDAKKIRRGIKKCFRWTAELFQIEVFPNDSSTKIHNAICVELDKFRSERPYRKRYLHTEAFGDVGPFVDWRGLVNFYQGKDAKQGVGFNVPEADS